ncbi:protein-tyrosine phosphatase-like protein [Mycena pura]|uniref:Protein-tyrosine phosphatase-like protein n=1 Tax=Mycena pura TaxID=153505 RepID=A0AAD6USL0_9AGAR|nr:protein-tyrosine phosphatase-like protein [Mycena pura]
MATQSYDSVLHGNMTEILPRLFLGSEHAVQKRDQLRRHGITHILSVMPDPPAMTDSEADDFRCMNIRALDLPDEELLTHFRDANAFIDHARVTKGEGVLVHCQMGVSRSAAVVAAYLIASHPPTPDAARAIAFLQARRPAVQPNWGFVQQLALYARCGADVERNPVALEAWRAGARRGPRWVGAAQSEAQGEGESGGPWVRNWRRASRWAASVFV